MRSEVQTKPEMGKFEAIQTLGILIYAVATFLNVWKYTGDFSFITVILWLLIFTLSLFAYSLPIMFLGVMGPILFTIIVYVMSGLFISTLF